MKNINVFCRGNIIPIDYNTLITGVKKALITCSDDEFKRACDAFPFHDTVFTIIRKTAELNRISKRISCRKAPREELLKEFADHVHNMRELHEAFSYLRGSMIDWEGPILDVWNIYVLAEDGFLPLDIFEELNHDNTEDRLSIQSINKFMPA
jgi:hypothetical protein